MSDALTLIGGASGVALVILLALTGWVWWTGRRRE